MDAVPSQLRDRRRTRWAKSSAPEPIDAVLCGVAALGCLFSQVHADRTEPDLVESAKRMLEESFSEPPSVSSITAWLLRVIYLRLAGTHYPAWMASCTVLLKPWLRWPSPPELGLLGLSKPLWLLLEVVPMWFFLDFVLRIIDRVSSYSVMNMLTLDSIVQFQQQKSIGMAVSDSPISIR